MALLSDRASRTSEVVVLPASTEDPTKPPPGLYRLGVLLACSAMTTFFGALVIAYYWRKASPGVWDQVALPGTLWISTAILAASSVTFEFARRLYRRGAHALSAKLLLITFCLGSAFLVAQWTAWRALIALGVYMEQNPYSSFFYIFTGLHAAHLLGGLIALAIVVFGRDPRREIIDSAAYYWHFLLLLWIVLFVVLST